MAERVLSVRLVALVDQYRQAMASSAKATQSVTDAAGRLQKVGDSISDIGGRLTSRVTLPLVAVGGLATKMAADFDGAFTRMQTLAGVSGEAVDGLKDSVLGLAGETGRAPQELAEALYFLSSSGLDSAAAMDALEMSAKASAAGLGSTAQVADAVSSAMNAYAQAGLTAAEATDVLVATAQQGKVEPAELAAQMGRLVPISADLGISFGEVGGAIAALSQKGNDAAASTTQLSNIMLKLVKPSQQALEMLDGVGLSLDDLHAMVAEKGLLGTLEELRSRLGDNGLKNFMEDAQAVTGVNALLGGDLEKTRQVIDAVKDSAGDTEKAFETWAESMGAKNSKAFAEMQVAMIRFGEAVAPVLSDVLGFIGGLAEAFAELDPWQQKAIVGFLAVAAAIGPLTSALGTVIHTIGSVQKTIDSFSSGLTNASAAALNTGTSASTAAGGVGNLAGKFGKLKTVLAAAAIAVAVAAISVELAKLDDQAAKARFQDRFGDLDRLVANLGRTSSTAKAQVEEVIGLITTGFLDADEVIQRLADVNTRSAEAFIDAAEAAGVEDEQLASMRRTLTDHNTAAEEAASGQDDLGVAMDESASSTDAAREAIEGYLDALAAQFDPLFGMIDALQGQADAQATLRQRTAELDEAIRDYGEGSAEAEEARRNLTDAENTAREGVIDLHAAATNLRNEMMNNGLSAQDAASQFINMALQMGFTQLEAEQMAGAFGFAASEADRLGHADATVEVGVIGWEEAVARLGDVDRAARAITQARVHVGVTGYGGGRALGGPVRANEVYTVGETGPEFFVPDRDGRIMTKAQASYAMAGSAPSGWGMGGGMYENHFHFHGPVASADDARRWVADAWNRAADSGLVNVRGRRV